MAVPGWKERLRPASFRGVEFKVDAAAVTGGRRGQTYEFPKRDDIEDEDLGRRAKTVQVTGYVIGSDYDYEAEELERALDTEGGGTLVLPNRRAIRVRCVGFARNDRRVEGGWAVFEMSFVEAPSQYGGSSPGEPTQANVNSAAYDASAEAVSAGNTDPSVKAGPR